jgi:Fur family transcriptional regulator, ferric uptake regulator
MGLGVATVYRSIAALLDEGWVASVELPGEPPRYERAGKEHHHHFRCTSCARVFDVAGCSDDLRDLVPRDFRLLGHVVTLYGVCGACDATCR